jgi:hypothetical protein
LALSPYFNKVESSVDAVMSDDNNTYVAPSDEKEHAAFSYLLIKRCAEDPREERPCFIGGNYIGSSTNLDEMLEPFKDFFVETVYEYLDEGLDDVSIMLSLLVRFKQKCEWFSRERLYGAWAANKEKGEKVLALSLYEFLYDQGVDFFIEPWSVSGEVDLISSQTGQERLIADAKIFDPSSSKGKNYLAKGFNQVYTYCCDYNQPTGYLVIFRVGQENLKFIDGNSERSIPYFVYNGKTIFFITIDINQYEGSASKRGVAKVIECSEADFFLRAEDVISSKSSDVI